MSVVIYKRWQQLKYFGSFLPTRIQVEGGGWVGFLALSCMVIDWLMVTVLRNWFLLWWVRKGPSTVSPNRGGVRPPTESSTTTSADPTLSDLPPDSLVVPAPVDGLLDGPIRSPDIRIHPCAPHGFQIFETESVFLVGEFSIPLGGEACQRHDTGEYMPIDGDFALGNRDRKADNAAYIRSRQTMVLPIRSGSNRRTARRQDVLRTECCWRTQGSPNDGAQCV